MPVCATPSPVRLPLHFGVAGRPIRHLLIAVALSACGGGSDPVTPPTPPPPPPPAAVASVSVTPPNATVVVGQSVSLSATPRDAAGAALSGRAVTWSSATPLIASVDATGRVTGVGAGSATISASSEGQSGQATIVVSSPPPAPVASVTVVSPGTILVNAQTMTLTATLRDANNTALNDRSVAWTSGSSNVATVDATGRVTGHAPGTATITATSEGQSGTTSVVVGEGGVVGPQGGTISAGSNAIVVVVPAGALAAPTPLRLVRNSAPPAHPGLVPGTAWDIAPATVTFAGPVTVTLAYEASAVPTGVSPLLFSVRRRAASTWDLLPGGELKVSQRSVSATTTSTGTLSIVSPVAFDVLSGTFDTGLQGWGPSGGESVVVSASAARTGAGGVSVSNRTAQWQGAGISMLAQATPGAMYTYKVWVRLAPGQSDANLGMSMEWRPPGGTSRFEQVARAIPVSSSVWTLLEGIYAIPSTATFARIKVQSAEGTASYYLDDFSLTRVETPVQDNIPALKTVVAPFFKLGTAILPENILTQHRDLMTKHFSSVTPGNHLKWSEVEPTEGQFDFADADLIVNYAIQNGMQIRGHTLLWHNQVPDWVFQDANGTLLTSSPAHQTILRGRLERHIRTIAQHYGNKIAVWDVVNEVIDASQPDGLRRTHWYNILGPGYIAHAFRVAREAMPTVKLVINDYQTERPDKREALYRLVAQLKADGVPVDGVGHQMHNNFTTPTLAQVEATIQRFIPLGVDQEITELDLTLYDNNTTNWLTPPAERLIRQGELYRDLFNIFRKYADNISTVTLWGPSDDQTWLNYAFVVRSDWPLLFDRQLQAKPAYWGIVNPAFIIDSPLSTRTQEVRRDVRR